MARPARCHTGLPAHEGKVTSANLPPRSSIHQPVESWCPLKRLLLVGVLLMSALSSVWAADHAWQHGVLRDLQFSSSAGGAISLPIGGTPATTVAGVTIPGTAPTYLSIPTTDEQQYVTIDGPDGLRYIARWRRRLKSLIINDPIEFVVEGESLFVKGSKPGDAFKLRMVSTTRLPPTD